MNLSLLEERIKRLETLVYTIEQYLKIDINEHTFGVKENEEE